MDVVEIIDRDSLRKWLKTRSYSDVAVLSLRSSMRLFPLFAQELEKGWAQKRKVSALPIFRLLILSAGRGLSSKELKDAASGAAAGAYQVYAAALDASSNSSDPARVAASAVASARSAGYTVAQTNGLATVAVNDAADVANGFVGTFDVVVGLDFWKQIRIDAQVLLSEDDLTELPLWFRQTVPSWFKSADVKARKIWAKDPQMWTFWIRWWDGVIAGKPLAWELQEQVALIPDDDWKKGQEHIAALIRNIEVPDYLDQIIRENPYAWRIELNHRTGIYSAVGIEKRDLSAVVSDVRSAINDFHVRCRKLSIGNFGQAAQLAFKPVIDMLRRDLRRYSDQPLALFKAIEAAKTEMQTIAEVEGLAGESYISRFFGTLEDNAEDICIASPDIVEQLKAKAALRYDLWDAERKRAMAVQTLALHLDADGILKRASFLALATIENPNSTEDDRKEAWYFMTANLPRAARAYLADKAEHGEAAVRSTESMARRIVEVADALRKLDKGKDAILEVYSQIPEGVDFVRSILESLPKN